MLKSQSIMSKYHDFIQKISTIFTTKISYSQMNMNMNYSYLSASPT